MNRIANSKTQSGGRLARIAALWLGLIAAAGLAPPGAWAQASGFGCSGLAGLNSGPVIEGHDGMFFRIDPDMMTGHMLSEPSVADLARLSRALEARGTRLIFVPLPTKALGQPRHVPQEASHYGFDPTLAVTISELTMAALDAAGVSALDARAVLHTASRDGPVFQRSDPRLTPRGIRTLALALADRIAALPGYNALPKTGFAPVTGEIRDIPSDQRRQMLLACQGALPQVRAEFVATEDLSDMRRAKGGVALVTSRLSGLPGNLFPALMQEFTGLPVGHVTGPNRGADPAPFAALTGYLLSDAFRQAPPAYLIWEVPIWWGLAAAGDLPMAELIAAAGPDCGEKIALGFDRSAGLLSADLAGLDPQVRALRLETGGVAAGRATFSVIAQSGEVRRRSIARAADLPGTARFFLPLGGLGFVDAARLEIALDVAWGPAPQLWACQPDGTP